jgi:CheY-like chemotaxis protein
VYGGGVKQGKKTRRIFADKGAVTDKPLRSADIHDPPEPGCVDLKGVRILVVEDSWDLGMAIRSLLEACDAEVAGPVASAADAERLIAGWLPNAAFVDIHLRAGERADDLIAWLHDRGVHVIVTSGDAGETPVPDKAAAILSKPFSEAELFAALRPVSAAATGEHPRRRQAPSRPGATIG